MNINDEIPHGYMRNAAGHLVPEAQVRDQDKLRDDIARTLVAEAIHLNAALADFKKRALKDIADLVSITAERYGVKIGGEKGNVTISSYDGEYKVIRSYADRVAFTEELEVAKELINKCIMRWSEGANNNIQALVDRAFRTNGAGQIKTAAVLELLRLNIMDDDWKEAMQALQDSMFTASTAVYIRVYKRSGGDDYEQMPLDLASV